MDVVDLFAALREDIDSEPYAHEAECQAITETLLGGAS